MPRTGRPPTPTEALKARGSYRDDRHADRIAPPKGSMECPEWVNPKAAEHWPVIVQLLRTLGVESAAFSISTAALVDAMADWLRFSAEAASAESWVTTDKGNLVQHPIHGMKNKAWDRVTKSLRDHGLTPSSLSSIKGFNREEKQSDPKDRFFAGPRLAEGA